MSSGARFGDKEEFMIQFNDVIDKNQKDLESFYNDVCSDVEEGEASDFVDTPSKIYANSMALIASNEKSLSTPSNKQDGKEEKEESVKDDAA